MHTLQDAANHIHSLAALYEPLVGVSDLLKKVGSLNTHIPELEKKRDNLFAENDNLQLQLDAAQMRYQKQIEDCEADLVSKAEQAARLETQAHEKIQELFYKAEADAALAGQEVYNAKLDEVNALEAEVLAKQDQIEELSLEIELLASQKVAAALETEQAQAALAEVVRTIEQLSKFGSVPVGDLNNGTK